MKDILRQIEFLDDELLPAFGFRSIDDYVKVVDAASVQSEQRLSAINACIPNLRARYVVKGFNLHKTNYSVIKPEQAISILKHCLKTSCIPHIVSQLNAVRLIPENMILIKYLSQRQKMSDIRDLPELTNEPAMPTTKMDVLSYLQKDDKNLKRVQTDVHHLTRRTDSKTIVIAPNILRKDLISVKLALKTADYVDEFRLKTALSSGRYKCTLGGLPIVEDDIAFDTNLLPTSYIFPVASGLTYHNLDVVMNFENVSDEAWAAVQYFVVVVEWTQISDKLMSKKGNNPFATMLPVSIPWNGQALNIANGMGEIGENPSRTPEGSHPLSRLPIETKVICGFKLAIASSCEHALFALLAEGADMGRYRKTVTRGFVESVRLVNGAYQVYHVLERGADTMSRFTIHQINGFMPNNAFLCVGQRRVAPLSDCDEENHLGSVNKMFDEISMVLEFPCDVNLQKLTTSFSYDAYVFCKPLRKQLSHDFTSHDIISIRELASLSGLTTS